MRAAQSVSVVFAPSGPRNGPTNKSTQRGSSFHGRGKSEGTKLVKQRRVDSPHLSPGNDEEEIFFVARFFFMEIPLPNCFTPYLLSLEIKEKKERKSFLLYSSEAVRFPRAIRPQSK